MYRHVEVIGFELISHLPKLLESVLPRGLLEAERLRWFGHLQI